MKKILLSIQLLLCIILSILTAYSQTVYELSWNKEMLISAAGLGTAITASVANNKLAPLTPEQINNLSSNEINWFDRSATYNWSKNASTISDVTVGLLIASPLTLFIEIGRAHV